MSSRVNPRFAYTIVLAQLVSACSSDAGSTSAAGSTADATDSDAASSGADGSDSSGSAATSEADDSTDSTTGAQRTGEEVFIATCASCHGMQGEGTSLGYGLQHPVRDYSAWVVRNGRPGTEFPGSVMAAYPEALISDEELESVFDYLDSFPQPTDGEGLYVDYCGNCHGTDAAGGVVDVDIRGELHEAVEKVREGEGGSNYAARTNFMPAWTSSELTNEEIAAIVTYVGSLP